MKLIVMGRAEGKAAGFDTAITTVPARWYVAAGGERTLVAQLAGRDLRVMSAAFAASLGEQLHHAEWTITSDPAEVTTLGLMHDCASCRAGVDQALTFLRDNPDGEIAVGQLWWARRDAAAERPHDPRDQPIGLYCPWCGQLASLIASENSAFCGNNDCKMLKWDPAQTQAEMEATDIHWLNPTGSAPGPGARPAAFSCPCCGAVSHHRDDAAHGYCARCHWWTGDPQLGPAHLAEPCPRRTVSGLIPRQRDER